MAPSVKIRDRECEGKDAWRAAAGRMGETYVCEVFDASVSRGGEKSAVRSGPFASRIVRIIFCHLVRHFASSAYPIPNRDIYTWQTAITMMIKTWMNASIYRITMMICSSSSRNTGMSVNIRTCEITRKSTERARGWHTLCARVKQCAFAHLKNGISTLQVVVGNFLPAQLRIQLLCLVSFRLPRFVRSPGMVSMRSL